MGIGPNPQFEFKSYFISFNIKYGIILINLNKNKYKVILFIKFIKIEYFKIFIFH